MEQVEKERVVQASLSYTNGALVTDRGRLLTFGGNQWEGGISQVRLRQQNQYISELDWAGTPPGYQCADLRLGHNHAFIIAQKMRTRR